MTSNINNEKKLKELIEILVCPKTGGKLTYDQKTKELISKKGKLAFPVLDNIPILLIEKAREIS